MVKWQIKDCTVFAQASRMKVLSIMSYNTESNKVSLLRGRLVRQVCRDTY